MMIKKILFITFLMISAVSFSQKTMKNLSAVPNPFVSTTTISFDSNTHQKTLITVQNVLGKTVFSTFIDAVKGKNTLPFSRKRLPAGIYIYTIRNTKETIAKRFIIK